MDVEAYSNDADDQQMAILLTKAAAGRCPGCEGCAGCGRGAEGARGGEGGRSSPLSSPSPLADPSGNNIRKRHHTCKYLYDFEARCLDNEAILSRAFSAASPMGPYREDKQRTADVPNEPMIRHGLASSKI